MKARITIVVIMIIILTAGALMACKLAGKNNRIVYDSTKIQTVTYQASDGLTITADENLIDNYSPIILLFHQAKSSRGEYLEIAPKLNDLGFNTLAVDARSGFGRNGVINQTAKLAESEKLPRNYADASSDITASITYAKETLGYKDIIIWGSSYSSSLVLAMGQDFEENLLGVLAFSPGEYFRYELKTIANAAKNLTVPVFITGAKGEKEDFEPIYQAIESNNKTMFIPEKLGKHGSSTLNEKTYGHEEYWIAVTEFLNSIKPEVDK